MRICLCETIDFYFLFCRFGKFSNRFVMIERFHVPPDLVLTINPTPHASRSLTNGPGPSNMLDVCVVPSKAIVRVVRAPCSLGHWLCDQVDGARTFLPVFARNGTKAEVGVRTAMTVRKENLIVLVCVCVCVCVCLFVCIFVAERNAISNKDKKRQSM